ncbi:DUF6932 family protein [Burkholderia thailandensis]|uniref:DUF6932 family protein n=1 Tax=Burkholderia thailandensis TaxID=57975 RepID=UPI0007522FF6|nr:hypothetical protein [Burkholderia thailandensis]
MAKPDFPPLLQPGMHNMTIDELHALAVAPFGGDVRRQELYQNLTRWCGALQALGIAGTLWLDGSFLTEKPSPGDIDCVLWYPRWVNGLLNDTPALRQQVGNLLDKASAESIFGLDLYLEMPPPDGVFHQEAYWRGVLGFGHDRVTAKGFAEINL